MRQKPDNGGMKLLFFALLLVAGPACADATGLLYDPQPPANSAYVRVVNASAEPIAEVQVDGRARLKAIAPGDASDYLVLPAGKRSVRAVSAKGEDATTALDVVAGRAITIAVPAFGAGAQPATFEDRANTNKLKAVIAVYHLGKEPAAVDVLTADGVRAFAAVRAGTSASLVVNPIQVEWVAASAGTKAPVTRAPLAMQPGGTYSLLLLPAAGGALLARAFQNKVERYTGRNP
jgi:alginate O-acetyltransferase complex protein AlgF